MNKLFLLGILLLGIPQLNYAQWQQTTGPSNVDCIISDGTNIFAGSAGSGVYSSSDGGINWNAVNTGLTNLNVQALIIHDNALFAGTNGGVFISYDSAGSWTPASIGLSGSLVRDFTTLGTLLYAGTFDDGVFVTYNDGASWTQINQGILNTSVEAMFCKGANLYTGMLTSDIYVSLDSGNTWTEDTVGLGTNTGIWSFGSKGTDIFAGTGHGIVQSSGLGFGWSFASNGLALQNIYSIVSVGNQLFAGTQSNGVFLSNDNGANWVSVNTGLSSLQTQTLAIIGNEIFAGVYNSTVWKRPLSDFITSVGDESESYNSKIYPNPISNSLFIDFELKKAEKTSIRLVDISGKLISTIVDVVMQQGRHEIEWPTKDENGISIPSGIYLLKFYFGNTSSTKKLVVIN